ncbi:MAG: flagellar FlbD family protein [Cyanobacteria bacterium HKST-UBA04]|nr:flagellar FlbD family protein [Cyanobacteria bacterium HKST-UBA04]MCA9841289.1 flagellar FlbD family protein [Cyanobacteria bacterium HKST-UBA03]
MIELTRINGSRFFVNPDQIMTVEETPDTVVTLINHERFIVTEKAATIAAAYEAYKARTHQPSFKPCPEGS